MKTADVLKGKWLIDSEPVLLPGKSEDWDGVGVYTPHILKDKGIYRMYYTGRNKLDEWAIGTATSTDLIHWTKHQEPILTSGGAWDKQIDFAWPVKDGETYYLYFEAKEKIHVPCGEGPEGVNEKAMTLHHMYSRSTGLATSRDGIHFQKRPRPALTADPNGTWDHNGICASRVYQRDNEYYMFYSGSDGKFVRSGLAFSTDLLHWERYEHNPIIDVGAPDAWDSLTTLFGSVIELEDGYLGAYEGEDGEKLQIGLAYSNDLKQWTRFEGNPIVGTEKNYVNDNTFVCAPELIIHEGSLYLLYTNNSPLDGKLCHIEIARSGT